MRKSLVKIPGGQFGQTPEPWQLLAHAPVQLFAIRFSDAERMIQDEVIFLMNGRFYDMSCNPIPGPLQKKLLATIPSSVTGVNTVTEAVKTAVKDSGVDV